MVAVGPADVLRRLGSLVLLGACVCTVLSAGSLVLAQRATAGLRPDPPKVPRRLPPPAPPPPAVSTTPAPTPDPAPPPATPPPPADVAPASAKQVPGQSRGASRTRTQARVAGAVRAATARARMRHLGIAPTRNSRVAKPVGHVTAVRPLPGVTYGTSSTRSHGGVIGVVLPLFALGLLLLGAVLVPADVLPWPEPARLLVELRGEITFAGLGILSACAVVSLILLFAS
jgi:hypothetical protein